MPPAADIVFLPYRLGVVVAVVTKAAAAGHQQHLPSELGTNMSVFLLGLTWP